MSLPTPKKIGLVIVDAVFSFIVLMVVLPAAAFIVAGVGVILALTHHWIIGTVLVLLAVVARYFRTNLRI